MLHALCHKDFFEFENGNLSGWGNNAKYIKPALTEPKPTS